PRGISSSAKADVAISPPGTTGIAGSAAVDFLRRGSGDGSSPAGPSRAAKADSRSGDGEGVAGATGPAAEATPAIGTSTGSRFWVRTTWVRGFHASAGFFSLVAGLGSG